MMRDAISNVLETMFFLIPGFVENEKMQALKSQSFVLESNIIIDGPAESLKLIFLVTRGFASMLTANFLGVGEGEVTVDQMEDTLKEFANMVGGDLLARLPSSNAQLGIPQLKQAQTDPGARAELSPCSVLLSFDEEPMAAVHLVSNNNGQLSARDHRSNCG